MSTPTRIVIVGAGQAGATAAATLRSLGYAGQLTVVGNEAHAPYERPPLSKQVLQDPAAHATTAIHPDSFYAEQAVTLVRGVQVSAVDPAQHEVHLEDGRVLPYDRCLLATGGLARQLPSLPAEMAGVYYLRTLDDAAALRAALRPGVRLAVVGAGFLGLEIASTALALGAAVTMIEGGDRLLPRALPQVGSQWLLERVRAQGVDLRLGARIQAVQGRACTDGKALPDAPMRLVLQDQQAVDADLVVVAIGLAPATELAVQAGLAMDPANGGITVDALCRSSAPDLYAAGDCASQHRDWLDAPARMESWQNANEQARIAAAAMLAQDTAPAAFPWFWTDQYGCNIQVLGMPQPDLEYVCRGQTDPASDAPKQLWLGHRGGIPVHAVAINAGGDLRQLRVLLERGLALEPARFADTAQALKPLVKACLAAA